MRIIHLIVVILLVGILGCYNKPTGATHSIAQQDSVVKIEMHLSAFGVESDNLPSIDAVIDLTHDSSRCSRSFYNPANKAATYTLTKAEIEAIKSLLTIVGIEKLKKEYKVSRTDQPSSTTKIFTTKKTFIIEDYGLEGDRPLPELYKIVYKY